MEMELKAQVILVTVTLGIGKLKEQGIRKQEPGVRIIPRQVQRQQQQPEEKQQQEQCQGFK